ncbi:MAG: TlpA disulfide reductase family protein [Bacteroidota bacterium]
MMRIKLLVALLSSMLFFGTHIVGQTVKKIKIEDLEAVMNKDDGKTRIVNLWATWCRPCVAEMPHFEELAQEYADKNVELLFVSLDFPDQLETRVEPFVARKGIKSEVVLLDETNTEHWMPKISPAWSGAIPATLIVNKSRDIREFHAQEFSKEELEKLIQSTL